MTQKAFFLLHISLLQKRTLLLIVLLVSAKVGAQNLNGDLWFATDGEHINAHGGCILPYEGKFYWYGESRSREKNGTMDGVAVYSSRDLQTWQNEGLALPVVNEKGSDIERGCLMERPKVLYNEQTKKFVMLFHLELKGKGYSAARVAFAESYSPTGPFRYLRSERLHPGKWPQEMSKAQRRIAMQTNATTTKTDYSESWHAEVRKGMFLWRDLQGGQMSRDMTLFVDTDGRAYHITSSQENMTLLVSELSDDYLSFTGRYSQIAPGGQNEAPCIFYHKNRYWLICSGCTGWAPNEARMFTSKNIWGPWEQLPSPFVGKALRNNNMPADKTFGAQGTYILPLISENQSSYIFMADIWNPNCLKESRHLWLPIHFAEDGTPIILWTGLLPDDIPVPAKDPGYEVTMRTLLEEMSDVTAHSKWEMPHYTCSQTSSYSRDSKTPNTADEDGKFRPKEGRDWAKGWFENHDFGHFYGKEGNEYVLLDSKGPGAVVNIWTAYDPSAFGTFRFYIDDSIKPVIEGDFLKLVGGEELVSYPFSFRAPGKTENDVWHGNNLILPIPYSNGCKITYEPNNHELGEGCGLYYQINYRSYEAGTRVKSFDSNSLKEYERDIYDCAMALTSHHDLLDNALQAGKSCTLNAGKQQTIKLKGERCITSLSLQIDAEDQPEALRNTYLSICFDGERTVYCPIGAFFGIGRRQLVNNTFYVKTKKNGLMTTYWAMPFARQAEVSLVNEGSQSIQVKHFQLTSQPSEWDNEHSMHFYASFCESKNIDTTTKFDYNFVTIHGRGKYIGDGLSVLNYMPDIGGWWGEGDEKIFVDGESFPSHFGTGTEDYYRYAYCRPQPFSFPNISQPIGEGNKTPGVSQNNRYRLLDDIPFTKSLAFYMEIWHPFYRPMDYGPATFWYAFPGCTWEHKSAEHF